MDAFRSQHNMSADMFSTAWASALVKSQQGSGCRYHLHKKRSVDAAEDFDPASIDVLFVDGLHTLSGVMADLEAYWPKLKARSLLFMNDYKPHPQCSCQRRRACHCSFPGVRAAACKFLASRGLHRSIMEEGEAGLTNALVAIGMQSKGANVHACDDML